MMRSGLIPTSLQLSPGSVLCRRRPKFIVRRLSLNQRTQLTPAAYENGATELLLHLSGTLQAIFRGSNFSVPVSIWVPHQYPKLPPMVFVTPQKDIVVRPGNHVDPSGRCYHPYLANWVNFSDVRRTRHGLEGSADCGRDRISTTCVKLCAACSAGNHQ